MSRVMAVVRIHSMDRANVFFLPWVVLGSSFVINLIFWALLPEAATSGTGGILSQYFLAVAMISVLIARGFPFQLGLGVTRRDFLMGTMLLVALFSVGNAVILTGLNLLEGATGGFGMGGRFFRAPWVTAVPSWQLVAIYALPMVFFVGLGMLYASIWLRYKMIGSVTLTIALALLGLAVTAVITWQDAWPSVGDWFAALQPLTAMLILGGLGAFTMAASWLTLRRAPV